MKAPTQHIKYFLFSQHLADGIRITLEILLPAIIGSYLGHLDLGLLMSTGALCVSISDAPGPMEHKFNGMLYCNLFIFAMALITGFATHSTILLGLLILGSAFFFTMFAVFGARASSIGISVLLIMILRMDSVSPAKAVFIDSLLILAGGVWYMLLALLLYLVKPYRQAQRALGNCIHETSKLLLIKADLYDIDKNVSEEYKRLLAQQVVVIDKQDEVRQILFKSKEIVKDTNPTGQLLLIAFTDAVDLYEQIIASWYDYDMLRERFSSTGILPEIADLIKNIADELDEAGLAIQANLPYKKKFELLPALKELKEKIDATKMENASNLVLKKILVNLRKIGEQANIIGSYFVRDNTLKEYSGKAIDYLKFVSHQEISYAVFRNNLSLDSSVFRHSLRMMITCLLGFIIVEMISYGHHSYWILLTIVFILKPGYSVTKERNFQRIAGTIAGGVLGIIFIATIKDRTVLLALMVFFMIGTYTFQRLNYIVTVMMMTPYILILFSYLGLGFINVVEERVLDTAIASVLAFFASYFLFPHWESKQLDTVMMSVLKANIGYLQKLKYFFSGKQYTVLEYKLVRKELYVSAANLSAAFTRMLNEPKSKQVNAAAINEFVVLNNVLSSNIASMFTINIHKESQSVTREIMQPLNRSIALLEDSMHRMDTAYEPVITVNYIPLSLASNKLTSHDMKEHIDFIYKLAADIRKVVEKIA